MNDTFWIIITIIIWLCAISNWVLYFIEKKQRKLMFERLDGYTNKKDINKHNKIIDLIEQFKARILVKYPNLVIGYEYNEPEDIYEIWHNNDLQFNDDSFLEFCGEVHIDLFENNNIYNTYFTFNYEKSKELENLKHVDGFKYHGGVV